MVMSGASVKPMVASTGWNNIEQKGLLPVLCQYNRGHTNKERNEMVISWNTKKVGSKFNAIVTKVEFNKPMQTLKVIENCKSRNIAKRQAQKWARYFKAA